MYIPNIISIYANYIQTIIFLIFNYEISLPRLKCITYDYFILYIMWFNFIANTVYTICIVNFVTIMSQYLDCVKLATRPSGSLLR